MLVDKNSFVRIRSYVLSPEQRNENIPEDTAKKPLKMWVKGRLTHEAELFEEAEIITATGRRVKGILKEVEPKYKHSYGEYVEEIQLLRELILSEMWSDRDEE